jgi:ketosteroid isomerase-like protein
MSQENMVVVRGMYESFSRGDVPGVLGQMDQGIEWREAGKTSSTPTITPMWDRRRCSRGYS